MTNEKATRRYLTAIIPGAIAYVGVSLALRAVEDAGLLPAPALYAVSIVPVGIMLGMFWAHWRYMNEIDEFLRSIQVKAAFVGLVAVLTVATGWGWVELYADAPRFSIFWLNPLYWAVYSIAAAFLSPREGGAT